MLKHSTQSGAHSQADRGHDLYDTPAVAVQALLRVESLPDTIWEPAAGRGAIVHELRNAGHAVIASDLVQYDFQLDFVGDFLAQTTAPAGVECILTNPPFDRRFLTRFVANALDLCPRVILLLRLAFMESAGRTDILENRGLARVHVFRDRLPMMHRAGWTGRKASNGMSFAWFVWEREHHGPFTVDRITANTGNGRAGSKAACKPEENETMTNGKKEAAPSEPATENVIPLNVPKPKAGVFERFRSKKPPTIGGVGTTLQGLPLLKLSEANDFTKLSPLPEHWSPELCFVSVPVSGEKKDLLHFIDEEIATKYLPEKRIKRFRLALGSKPYGVFFLAMIPTVNLDNSWNSSMVAACEQAKEHWVSVSSRKAEGRENYKIDFAKDIDAFPDPDWAGAGDIERIVELTFNGTMIEDGDHPALLRLTGRKPSLA